MVFCVFTVVQLDSMADSDGQVYIDIKSIDVPVGSVYNHLVQFSIAAVSYKCSLME